MTKANPSTDRNKRTGLSKDRDWWPAAAFAGMRASRWELFFAKLLGKKVTGFDAGCTVVGYRWRGKLYMTEVKYGGIS